MATYEALRQAIDSTIRANGNNEITGEILNNVLNAMITALGANYQFCGEAKPSTNPGQPLQNVFYFAYDAGTYTNFGNITLPLGISTLSWDGTQWTGDTIYQIDTAAHLNSTKLITSGAVWNAIHSIYTGIGYGKMYEGIADPSTVPSELQGVRKFYIATQAGTYQHFFSNGDIPLVIPHDGIWVISSVTGDDNDDWYLEDVMQLDNIPTKDSGNPVKSGGVFNNIGAFDISELNATENPHTPAKYADLSAALNALPTQYRKGGMSVKFVQSSDNNYVQYRYMGTDVTGTPNPFLDTANWQGVDDKPTFGNPNLVRSEGVKEAIIKSEQNTFEQFEKVKSVFNENEDNTFYLTDHSGNVVAKVNAQGLQAIDFLNKNGVPLSSLLSQKVDKENGKGLSTEDYTTLEKSNLEFVTMEAEYRDNEFSVCDQNGYVIGKLDVDGFHTTNVNSESVISKLSKQIICDNNGYVLARLDKNGFAIKNIFIDSLKDLQGNIFKNFYSNYELFSIGDSLSTSGKWQNEVAKNLGLLFDNSKNILSGHQISTGGTTTGGEGFDNAVWRTKNLIDGDYIQGDGENAVIILECINDVVSVGTDGLFDDSAKSIIPTDPIEGYSYSNWGTSLLQSIPTADRKMNAVLALEQTTSGKNLAITNMPSSDGQICLRIYTAGAGTLDYYINILSTDTLQDILDKILEINYTTVTDTLAQDEQSVDFVGGNITVTFIDTDSTGMTVSITDTTNAKRKRAYYFIGDSVTNDWEDTSKWLAGTDLTFSMGYKSVIEMIQRTYPKAHIIIGMFPLHNTNPEDFLLSNGTYDTKAYSETTRTLRSNNLREQLQKIADFYCIPIIDVYGSCGIGISNYSTYYRNNNVHPKDTGYIKIGQTIASEIKRYI